MAGRKTKSKRIEPKFERPDGGLFDLRLSAEDRVAGNAARASQDRKKPLGKGQSRPDSKPSSKPKKPSGSHGRKKPASPDNRRKRGGGNGRGGRRKKRSNFSRWLRPIVYWCLVLGIWGGIALAIIVGYHASKLPQMSSWAVPERPPNARIVSVDGELIANRGATGGEAMPMAAMSPYVPMAVIAIEDHRFHKHFGIDPLGLARAMATNVWEGRLVQGGSTITQQLAKNLFLQHERTLGRKIQEAVLAIWLETKYSKDEILELYLNRVYFGSGAYGVDAAARRYFSKSARDVTLAEAALLAGLLKAPSRLSPARDAKAAEERGQLVLAAMAREGFVTEGETSKALAMQAKKAKRYWSGSEHYIADMVMAQLTELIGEIRGDVIVDTSVDLDLQKDAGQIIARTIDENGERLRVSQGALVALDGTGAIRALVGGREYADSQFNRAVDAKRQPGSAFKPFVYLTALEADRTPESIRRDAPIRIGKWTPENYDREYRGPVTLREALSQSLNTVAAQLVMETGPKTVIETAHRLGIDSDLQRNASIALGTSEVSLLELTSAYAPFANGGYGIEPWLIRSVRDMDGEILYSRKTPSSQTVVGARELAMMNSMLAHVITSGTGKAAAIEGWEAAGKTGTTQNSKDALFVGYTSNLITGIWYGNDDNAPMKKVTGGSLPAQSWSRFMNNAHQGVPVAKLPGDYEPRITAVPSQRPDMPNNPALLPQFNGESPVATLERRRSGVPRPGAELAPGTRQKPRSILELLFGRREEPG